MNRRELFKLVGMGLVGVIAAPFLQKSDVIGSPVQVVSAADLAKQYPPVGPWQMIAWQEQEFTDELGRRCESWVDRIGFCGIFQDQETRELRRNAVRFEWTRSRSDHRADASRMLRAWGDHLNANWPPDLCRRPTQWFDVFDQHGKLVGWHFDDRWKDSDYAGYRALGYGAVARSR